MLFNELPQIGQLVTSTSPRLRQYYGIQPKLGILFSALDMNMTRLISFPAKKEKPKAAYAQYFGHATSLSFQVNSASMEGVRLGPRTLLVQGVLLLRDPVRSLNLAVCKA